jgi:hypothetical protein
MSSACTTSVPTGIDTLNERWTGIIDITKPPFNAKGDGTTDCTKAFQDAFMHGYTFVYIPNGKYLLSDSVGFSPRWDTQNGGKTYGFGETKIVMWGESRNGVKIVLKQGSTGFGSASTPKAFFNTGYGSPDRIGTSIYNVTFEIESGNPGAIGLRYYANNYGGMYNITIRALGTSLLGLDKGFNRANGPTLTKDVLIEGFQTGIKTGFSVESETYEHITLKNQTLRGWFNKDQILSIRDLKVTGCKGAALTNESGFINLLESDLQGTGDAAIRNGAKGKLLVRNLTTSGYTRSISDPDKPVSGSTITQYLSNQGVGPDGKLSDDVTTLNLTVKETPVIPWETDVTKWVDPGQFGATAMNARNGVGCGKPTTCQPCDDDTKAVQDAINSTKPGMPNDGATTLFLSSTYRLNSTIHITGSIKRIISTGHTSFAFPYEGTASGTPVSQGGVLLTGPAITIDSDAQPQIEFESLSSGAANHTLTYIENPYGKTVIFKNCQLGPLKLTGGEAFFESTANGAIVLNNVNTWARAIDPEPAKTTKVAINGGNYWGLGLKTEETGNVIQARNRAKIEQFGAYLYSTHDSKSSTMFDIENSEISVSMTEYLGAYGAPFGTLVKDAKGQSLVTISRGTTTPPTYPANWSQFNDSTVTYQGTSCTDCKAYNANLVGSEMLLYRNTSTTGAPENWVTVDDNDPAVTYTGAWTLTTGNTKGDFAGTAHTADQPNYNPPAGLIATFNFTGDKVEFYSKKRPDRGQAEVFIDGTSYGIVDFYDSNTLWNQLVFQSPVLTAGSHKLEIKTLGTKNASANASQVDLDAIAYRSTAASSGTTTSIDRTDAGGTATARGQINEGEGASKAFDNNFNTSKWLDQVATNTWIQFTFANSAKYAVDKYTITSGNDASGRDPKSWRLLGTNVSNPAASDFTEVHKVTDYSFTERNQKIEFVPTSKSTAYSTYRLEIISNAGDSYTQLNEIELFAPDSPPASSTPTGGGSTTLVDRTDAASSPSPTITAFDETYGASAKAFDNSNTTSWASNGSKWIQFQFSADGATKYKIEKYTITSNANSAAVNQDPKDWTLYGTNTANANFSKTPSAFTKLDTRTGITFNTRKEKQEFIITEANRGSYSAYTLVVTATAGNIYTQLSEIELFGSSSSTTSSVMDNAQLQLNQNTVAEKITVFPNPVADGWLTVGLTAADKNNKVDVSLSDLSGRIVYRSNFISNGISERLNIGNVQPGIYVIRITGSNTKFNAKIVVQ